MVVFDAYTKFKWPLSPAWNPKHSYRAYYIIAIRLRFGFDYDKKWTFCSFFRRVERRRSQSEGNGRAELNDSSSEQEVLFGVSNSLVTASRSMDSYGNACAVHATIIAVTAAAVSNESVSIFILVYPEIIYFFCNLHRERKMSSGQHMPSRTCCDDSHFHWHSRICSRIAIVTVGSNI